MKDNQFWKKIDGGKYLLMKDIHDKKYLLTGKRKKL